MSRPKRRLPYFSSKVCKDIPDLDGPQRTALEKLLGSPATFVELGELEFCRRAYYLSITEPAIGLKEVKARLEAISKTARRLCKLITRNDEIEDHVLGWSRALAGRRAPTGEIFEPDLLCRSRAIVKEMVGSMGAILSAFDRLERDSAARHDSEQVAKFKTYMFDQLVRSLVKLLEARRLKIAAAKGASKPSKLVKMVDVVLKSLPTDRFDSLDTLSARVSKALRRHRNLAR